MAKHIPCSEIASTKDERKLTMSDNMLGKLMKLIVTVPAEWLGTLVDLVEKLCGDEGRKWLNALKLFLRKENPWDIRNWQVWKTILLGTGPKTADDFRKALKKGRHEIGNWGNDILGKPAFKVSETKIEVDLVRATVGELGFKNGATNAEIFERAKELGLELCPNEVGPQLRLQYEDQPTGEWLLIAMEPILDSGGSLDRPTGISLHTGEKDLADSGAAAGELQPSCTAWQLCTRTMPSPRTAHDSGAPKSIMKSLVLVAAAACALTNGCVPTHAPGGAVCSSSVAFVSAVPITSNDTACSDSSTTEKQESIAMTAVKGS